jgi:hydrogenase/urease accessory protein HupE
MTRLACTFLLALLTATAYGHETRPAYLEIDEFAGHQYEVLWKQPTMGDVAVRLVPHLSNQWLETAPYSVESEPGFVIKRWRGRYDQSNAVRGSTVSVEGVDQTITDILVSVNLENGKGVRGILRAGHDSLKIRSQSSQHRSVPAYLRLGIEHILTGFDHLLFVLGLLLLVRSRWQLLKTITAFTVAHSITLAAATLGWVRVEPAVIEALVALSIIFLALELLRSHAAPRVGTQTNMQTNMQTDTPAVDAGASSDTLTVRYPWLIAFAFGLLHGLAFAGSLAEVGIPRQEIPLALFLFNVGVEIGQLLFVGVVWVLLAWLQRARTSYPRWMRQVAPYAIGSLASFWFIERLAAAAVNSP